MGFDGGCVPKDALSRVQYKILIIMEMLTFRHDVPDWARRAEIVGRVGHMAKLTCRDQLVVDAGDEIGRNHEFMVQNIIGTIEVIIRMQREIDDGGCVGGSRKLGPKRRGLDKAIPARHRQIARKAAIAIGREQSKRYRIHVMMRQLPRPLAKAGGAAMQAMLA